MPNTMTKPPPYASYIIKDLWPLAQPIDQFKLDKTNAKKHTDIDLNETAASLSKFKQRKAIVYNSNNNVIEAGNGTWQAAKRLGWEYIAAVGEADDPRTHVEFGIADNATALVANFDVEQLNIHLQQMDDPTQVPGITAKQAAAVAEELKSLAQSDSGETSQQIEPTDSEPQTEKADELVESWGVEPGQVWQLGRHTLVCGNSTDRTLVARLLQGVIELSILTDPPYPDRYQDEYGYHDGIISLLDTFKGQQFVFWSAAADFPLSYSAIHIWDKKVGTRGNQYERVFERNGQRGYRVFRHYLVNSTVAAQMTHDEFMDHPSQKPIALIQELAAILPGVILDLFCGSGTTLIACENLGRECRAVELKPGYVAVTLQRFFDHTGTRPKLKDERHAIR